MFILLAEAEVGSCAGTSRNSAPSPVSTLPEMEEKKKEEEEEEEEEVLLTVSWVILMLLNWIILMTHPGRIFAKHPAIASPTSVQESPSERIHVNLPKWIHFQKRKKERKKERRKEGKKERKSNNINRNDYGNKEE